MAHDPIYLPVRAAWTFLQRARGLLGRPAPAPGTGLFLPGCSSVHTLGMRYPIDVVFLGHYGEILAAHAGVAPGRLRLACRGAASTIELATGQAASLGLTAGNRVSLLLA